MIKKIFLLILSVICLNSCYSLMVKPITKTTAAVISVPFKLAGKMIPKKDKDQYRSGYHAYMVEEYNNRVDKLLNDVLKRQWVQTEFYSEKILLPEGLFVKNGILVDKETEYGLPVRFLKDEYPCYFDNKKNVFDLKTKEEFFIKGSEKNFYRIESETEKGKLIEKMILEKNNVQRGCKK